MIYDQGFEIRLRPQQGRPETRYFAFFDYATNGSKVISYCFRTSNGWFHDAPTAPGVLPVHWGCYKAEMPHHDARHVSEYPLSAPARGVWRRDDAFVLEINARQSLWRAEHNAHLDGLPVRDVLRMAGTQRPRMPRGQQLPGAARGPVSEELRQAVLRLPRSFDWRNVRCARPSRRCLRTASADRCAGPAAAMWTTWCRFAIS